MTYTCTHKQNQDPGFIDADALTHALWMHIVMKRICRYTGTYKQDRNREDRSLSVKASDSGHMTMRACVCKTNRTQLRASSHASKRLHEYSRNLRRFNVNCMYAKTLGTVLFFPFSTRSRKARTCMHLRGLFRIVTVR